MNILFYQHQYPAFGGIETVTTLLANAFAADGHRVTIVSFIHKEGTDLLSRLHASVSWHELPRPDMDSCDNEKALGNLLDDFMPDRIVFQDSYANIQGTLFRAVAAWRQRHSATVGANPNACLSCAAEHSAPRFSLARRTNPLTAVELAKRIVLLFMRPFLIVSRFRSESRRRKAIFDNVDGYVVLSENYRRRIGELVGQKRLQKLRAIPNPLVPCGNPATLGEKKKQVLFVGSLIVTKGVDRLIAIWERLAPMHSDWEFVIVGDGVERPQLERQVAARQIHGVRFEGFKRDVAPYYREASILVMASDFEGWPMVLGEAMQQGCVPISYDSFAAVFDLIDDGVNGRIVRHFSKCAYVVALGELMEDEALRKRMAIAAQGKASRYSIDNVKKMWYSLFNSQIMNGGHYTTNGLDRGGNDFR